MTDQDDTNPLSEPSVWDHFVSRIKFWSKDRRQEEKPKKEIEQPVSKKKFPWLTLGALTLALIAQLSLEPSSGRTFWPGVVFYAGALGCLIAAFMRKEWHLPALKPDVDETLKPSFRWDFFLIGIVLAVFAFLLFGSGEFTFLNTFLWALSMIFVLLAFWKRKQTKGGSIREKFQLFWQEGRHLKFTRWTLIVLAVIAVILFFNFYQLDSVPPEMNSDHAEKLMDVNDIVNGNTPVYFTRNTGREGLQFYLTAAYINLFNLDVSFLSLKTVCVFANLVTLLFIYLLGKEVGNKWVGLAAVLFAGMAYWPLVITRIALRMVYYPLFVAPVMYFMVRGLRRQKINDLILTGLFLGLGLHGYTSFRIVPIFVVIGIIIYLLHKSGRRRAFETVFVLVLIAFIAMIVFIPLMRYWLDNPEVFSYRALSRLTGMEAAFEKSPIVIFFENFWKASIMFFWEDGVIWVHSVTQRPALEVVSGALYFLGIAGLLIRYIRKRNWRDLFILVSIPMLLMPSILSLAFPGENPCLNRTAGAIVPVFVVIGLAFESIIRSIWSRLSGRLGKTLLILLVVLLLVWSAANNYDLVFNQYYSVFQDASWNTSEIGQIAEMFTETLGTPDTVYVVGYAHWVDSRLVAIVAGYPGMDFAIFTDQIPETANDPQAKMFFLNVNDGENMQLLLETFPNGVLQQYDSAVENKDFMIFYVPPSQGAASQ